MKRPLIESSRLQFVSMSLELLRLLRDREFEAAQRMCDFLLPPELSLPEKIWLERRIRMIEADPAQHPWMYRAIVRKIDRQMIGYISFHHKAPDPDLLGHAECGAELGYTIEPAFRRNGYGRESAIAMMKWAYREHGVRTFCLSISPSNVPSMRMAQAMGFQKVAERQDDEDGLEFTMRADLGDLIEGSGSLTIPQAVPGSVCENSDNG